MHDDFLLKERGEKERVLEKCWEFQADSTFVRHSFSTIEILCWQVGARNGMKSTCMVA